MEKISLRARVVQAIRAAGERRVRKVTIPESAIRAEEVGFQENTWLEAGAQWCPQHAMFEGRA